MKPYTRDEVLRWYEYYMAGAVAAEVGIEFGVSESAVYRLFRAYGLPRRRRGPRGRRQSEVDAAWVLRFVKGVGVSDIGDALGIPASSVAGLFARPPSGEAARRVGRALLAERHAPASEALRAGGES